MKKIRLIFFTLAVILGVLSILNIFAKSPLRVFTVLSGSMRPKIKEGSVIIVNRKLRDFKINDVITFINPNNQEENITHRIIEEERAKNQIFYKTRGDANNTADLWKIRKEAIFGKVVFCIPLLGYLIDYSQTKIGVILLIDLPLLFIIISELKTIFSEIKKIRNIVILLLLTSIMLTNFCKTSAKFSHSITVYAQQIETGSWQTPTSKITNTETVRNSSEIEINYFIDYPENMDFVQLCYSYNLEKFNCPNNSNFMSKNGKFNFHFEKNGLWSFYTIYYDKNGKKENLDNLAEKIYSIQIDTQSPTTNLDLTNLITNKWSGQNLLRNGDFENGGENWNILNGNGDHHTISNSEGTDETILPISGKNMFMIGFKDSEPQNNQTDSIFQMISIPKNISSDLSFWSRFVSNDIADYDQFKVQIRRPDDEILENILTIGNLNGDYPFDSGWKNYTRSMDSYAGKTIKLWFEVEDNNNEDIKKSWAYLDDIKLTTLNTRIGETFAPELDVQDTGSGVLSTSSLMPEIQPGENTLIYNSTDIANNKEQTQASNIFVSENITINKFNNNFIELFNNSNEEIDLNNWQICTENGNCKQFSTTNSENGTTIIMPKGTIKFFDYFFLQENNKKIILKNNLNQDQDSFIFSDLGDWKRSIDGIGTWILDNKKLDINIISRLSVNKITMTVFNIPNEWKDTDNLNYEIIYTSQGQEKGIAGIIDKNTIENSKTDRDFYLGTCSTGGSCRPEPDIGSIFTVTVNGKLDDIEIEPITKTFNLN